MVRLLYIRFRPLYKTLIPRGVCDESGVPDYNAVVEVLTPERAT